MPEGNVNSEVAEHLREHGHHAEGNGGAHKRLEWVEILEAILLSLVALATAWSGYQAAKWDGESSREYATSSKLRAQSTKASLSSNQILIYNTGTFNSWLQADVTGDKKLADLLARRYTPEYKVAFEAWLKLDPLTNPKAPPGPRFMPQYRDPVAARGAQLDKQATEAFAAGVDDRATAEHYVRVTVVLAAVLFLIALGQRFDFRGVRIAVITVAGVFLVYAAVLLITYPHV